MFLYFDNDGILKTKIDHGDKLRQGSDLHITVCLDCDFFGERIINVGNGKTSKIYRDDNGELQAKGDSLFLTLSDMNDFVGVPISANADGTIQTFEKLFGSEIVYNLSPNRPYLMYEFDIPASLASGFFGKVKLNFECENNLSTNDYVRIAKSNEWQNTYALKNGEVGIAYDDATESYTMRIGTETVHDWSSLSESVISSGVGAPTKDTSIDNYYIDKITHEVWHWQTIGDEGYWDKLVGFTPTTTIRTGAFAFSSVEVIIEKTVGYERRKIDEQLLIRYQDIIGEIKKAFAKIAIASTKPDWKENDETSPAYIRNKPTIVDQSEFKARVDKIETDITDINSDIAELQTRPVGTQIKEADGSIIAEVNKSDIIFAEDEVVVNGGDAGSRIG